MAQNPPKTNAEIRGWYLAEVATIPKLNREWIKNGLTLDVRARKAWKFRHDKRRDARH